MAGLTATFFGASSSDYSSEDSTGFFFCWAFWTGDLAGFWSGDLRGFLTGLTYSSLSSLDYWTFFFWNNSLLDWWFSLNNLLWGFFFWWLFRRFLLFSLLWGSIFSFNSLGWFALDFWCLFVHWSFRTFSWGFSGFGFSDWSVFFFTRFLWLRFLFGLFFGIDLFFLETIKGSGLDESSSSDHNRNKCYFNDLLLGCFSFRHDCWTNYNKSIYLRLEYNYLFLYLSTIDSGQFYYI